MKLRWLVLAVALGAGPPTSPTTQPTTSDLEGEVVAAEKAVESTKRACFERLEATSDYNSAVAKAESLRKRLEDVRATGSAQQKLDASREFVAMDQVVKKMRADAIKNDPQVQDSLATLVSARTRLGARQADDKRVEADRKKVEAAAAAERDAKDPIKQAIRLHKVVRGMTEADADFAMEIGTRGHHKQVNELEDGTRIIHYQWGFPAFGTLNGLGSITRDVRVVFEKGKAVEINDSKV